MASVNTKIESLTMNGREMTAKFSSTNPQAKYEVILDGWKNWKPAENPLVLGFLNPGTRSLSVRSYSKQGRPDPTPAVRQFVVKEDAPTEPPVEPPVKPPVEPTPDLPLLHTLDTRAKWDAEGSILLEAPGSSITDVTWQGRKALRIHQPQKGERVETQLYDERIHNGTEALYEWFCWIPGAVKLPKIGDDNTINQMHGNNQAGYTGGLAIREDTQQVSMRVKGGEQTSASGSHRYEYESDGKGGSPAVPKGSDELGVFPRDRWNKLSWHCRWSDEWDGFVRCRLNDGPLKAVEKVPTFSNLSDVMMTRTGWYPGSTLSLITPLEMFVADFKVYAEV